MDVISNDRSGHNSRHAAADFVHPTTGVGVDPARRHLLRRPVRRLDHRHPGQHPGRGVLGRHHHRRSPDGASGTRRTGARHRRAGFVLRRLCLDAADRARGSAACGRSLAVRSGGIFLPDGVRLGRSRRSGARIARQSDRDGRARFAPRSRRHRREYGRPAVQFRHDGACRRHRVRGDFDGDLRRRRGRLQPGKEAGSECRFARARQGVAEPRRSAAVRRLDPGWRRKSPGRRANSAMATSGASRRRNPPTMRARRRRSFRC